MRSACSWMLAVFAGVDLALGQAPSGTGEAVPTVTMARAALTFARQKSGESGATPETQLRILAELRRVAGGLISRPGEASAAEGTLQAASEVLRFVMAEIEERDGWLRPLTRLNEPDRKLALALCEAADDRNLVVGGRWGGLWVHDVAMELASDGQALPDVERLVRIVTRHPQHVLRASLLELLSAKRMHQALIDRPVGEAAAELNKLLMAVPKTVAVARAGVDDGTKLEAAMLALLGTLVERASQVEAPGDPRRPELAVRAYSFVRVLNVRLPRKAESAQPWLAGLIGSDARPSPFRAVAVLDETSPSIATITASVAAQDEPSAGPAAKFVIEVYGVPDGPRAFAPLDLTVERESVVGNASRLTVIDPLPALDDRLVLCDGVGFRLTLPSENGQRRLWVSMSPLFAEGITTPSGLQEADICILRSPDRAFAVKYRTVYRSRTLDEVYAGEFYVDGVVEQRYPNVLEAALIASELRGRCLEGDTRVDSGADLEVRDSQPERRVSGAIVFAPDRDTRGSDPSERVIMVEGVLRILERRR